MEYYINESWPRSNSQAGVKYALVFEGHGLHTFETVEDLGSAISQARRNNWSIKAAHRIYNGTVIPFIPETDAERSSRENWEHCKDISEDIDNYISDNVRRCPECGEIITRDWDDVGDCFKCPHCEAVTDPDDWEAQTLYDYLSDALDIEYTVSGKGPDDYKGVRITVAWGGPNIYLDTMEKAVLLYWWTDHAKYYLSNAAVDALDDWAREYWEVM